MGWPALLLSAGDAEGTHYIRGRDFPEVMRRHYPKGQAWKYRGKWTTYVPSRKLAYKNVDRFGDGNGRPITEETFWTVIRESQAAGINPPTSYADMWLSCYDLKMPRATPIAPFRGFRFGGWEATYFRGTWDAPAYLYDLNSAYRWAASCGLPDVNSGFPTKSWNHERGVWLARIPMNRIPYARAGGVMMVTSEERDMFALQTATDCYPIYGFAFRRDLDVAHVFDRVEQRFPASAKKISRAFWGMWNTNQAPEQVSWKHGEKSRMLRNPFYNPIWSAFITSRVKMRLAPWIPHALSVYVDGIIMKEPMIPTGPELGAFRLQREFPRGLWIKWAGHWGDDDGAIKHAGIPADHLVRELGD